MKIEFNLSGKERKKLVSDICEITGMKARYMFLPSCAYRIGDCYTVSRHGTLDVHPEADAYETIKMIDELVVRGYEIPGHSRETVVFSPTFTVRMPIDSFRNYTFQNLDRLIVSMGDILKEALNTDSLKYNVGSENVDFPWFTIEDDNDKESYTTFMEMLIKHLDGCKCVRVKKCNSDNPKEAFRLFLIRIGIAGPDFKKTRKVLLRNLEGNSAMSLPE